MYHTPQFERGRPDLTLVTMEFSGVLFLVIIFLCASKRLTVCFFLQINDPNAREVMSPGASVGGDSATVASTAPDSPAARAKSPPTGARTSTVAAAVAEHASLNAPHPDNLSSKRTAKDFIFGKVIGEGCFSTVYLAKYIRTGKEYASECRFNLILSHCDFSAIAHVSLYVRFSQGVR